MATLYRYSEPMSARGGLKTAQSVAKLRAAVRRGIVDTIERTLKEGERLDTIAAVQYGDGRLWWVIAAASNIGWWQQLPPGTLLKVPTNILQVNEVI